MGIRYNLTVNIKQPVINSVYSIKKNVLSWCVAIGTRVCGCISTEGWRPNTCTHTDRQTQADVWFAGSSAPHLTSSSFSRRAACFDCFICKSSLCKKSLADSSSGWGGLESAGGGEGGGVGPSMSRVTTPGESASWHAASPSPSGDSRDSPLNM